MFVGQFKLDHLVEKNNECIVYRASHEQQKYMVIQVNRNPILKIPQYFNHFQKELDFIFKRIPPPRIVPQDFPFILPQQQFYDFEEIELPQIFEIHQTENHYYFVLTNCLQGVITNQQYNPVKVFQQVFNIFDLYYIPFQQKQISDRDFNINRLFWSYNQLSIIDFGFQLIQKPQKNIAWTIKLGSLLNVILKQEKNPNLRKIVNLLLQNKVKQWDQIKELFVINLITIQPSLDFDKDSQFSQFSQYSQSKTKPIYSKTQSLSMEPEEIIITNMNQSFCKATVEKRSYSPVVLQSRIIRKGTNELKQHFDRIKKSLSPGMSNRSPYKLVPIDSIYQDQYQSRSVSRRSYTKPFNVTKPIEVPFEYKQSDYEDQKTKDYIPEANQKDLVSTFVMPVRNAIKQSEIDTIDRSKDNYIPTLLEQQQKKKSTRPQTALNFTKDADPDQKTPQMKTLLRKSTRDLQQPDIRQNPREQTQETIEKKINEKEYIQKPSSRRNSLRITSARKQSNQSIENIELNQDRKEKPIEKLSFKTPKGMRKDSLQNTQLPQIQQTSKAQTNTGLYEKVIQNNQQNLQFQQIDNHEQQQQQQLSQQKQQIYKQTSKYTDEECNFYTFNQQCQQNEPNKQQYIEQQTNQFQQQQQQQQQKQQEQEQQLQQHQQQQLEQQQQQIKKQNFLISENSPKDNQISINQKKLLIPQDEQFDEPSTIFSKKGPLSSEKKNSSENQNFRQLLTKQKSQEGKLQTTSKQNQNGTQILKRIDDDEGIKQTLNIFDGVIQQHNVQEIQFSITDEEELEQFKIYETQLKKQDIIGVMVGSSLRYFQATKNYWIIPLFICFKRMVNFRFQLEKSIANKVNLFNLDMKKVSVNKRIEELHQKICQENLIVINELKSLFSHCEQISKKFEKKELVKIEKYLNMEIDQDIKDIYFIYLYSQILKTIQQKYPSDDLVKQKENLKLQASVMASLIISEVPYSNDLKIFDYFEYEAICNNYNQKQMQQYLKQKEDQIGELKKRLIQKGIKI